MLKPFLIILFFSLFTTGCSLNPENKLPQNKVEQKMASILDTEQSLSSDGKWTVFIRDIGDERPSENFGEGYDSYNQIVIKNNDTNEERVIVNAEKIANLNIKNIDEFPIDVLVGLSNPVFSLDGDRVFFNSVAWTTSLATFYYDINTGNLSYLTHGSIKETVKEGKNAGHLVLIKRKHIENQPVMYCEFVINGDSGEVIEDLNICL
jgi:Tol biopolymer transport system component